MNRDLKHTYNYGNSENTHTGNSLFNSAKVYVDNNLVGYALRYDDPQGVRLEDLLTEDTKTVLNSINSIFYEDVKDIKILLLIDKETFNSEIQKHLFIVIVGGSYYIEQEDIDIKRETVLDKIIRMFRCL